jgi:hypothetical protein
MVLGAQASRCPQSGPETRASRERQRVVRWFVLQDGTYRAVGVDARGLFKSTVFPGLWLDAPALLRHDIRQVMATLQHGIETPEHAAFVQQLQARRRAS